MACFFYTTKLDFPLQAKLCKWTLMPHLSSEQCDGTRSGPGAKLS
jgi:hypothetical protein